MKKILHDVYYRVDNIDRMKTKKPNNLPKTAAEITNGGLYHQLVRCGKSNCRCAAGDLHEGYFYFIRQVNGRQRKTYVPKRRVKEFSMLVHQSRMARQNERRFSAGSRDLLAALREELRGHDSVIRHLEEALNENG